MDWNLFDIYDGNEPYLFISYAHADEQVVFPLIADIQKAGYRIWMDRGIEVGTEWSNNIADRLNHCEAVIFFVSKNSIQSENCLDEIACAKSHKKPAILIFLEDDVVMPGGVEMQTARFQRLYTTRHSGNESLLQALNDSPLLEPCRVAMPAPVAEPVAPVVPIVTTQYCVHCGAQIRENSKFCDNCGKPQQSAAPAPVQAPEKKANFLAKLSKKTKILVAVIAAVALVAVSVAVALTAHAGRVYTAIETSNAFKEAGYRVTVSKDYDSVNPSLTQYVSEFSYYEGTREVDGYTDEWVMAYLVCTDEDSAAYLYGLVLDAMLGEYEETTYADDHRRAVYTEEIYGECEITALHGNVVISLMVDYEEYTDNYITYDHLPESICEKINF